MNSNDYYWGWENAVGLLLLMLVLAIAFIPPQQLQQIIQQLLNGLVEGTIMGAVIALAIVVTVLFVKKRMKEEVEW
jgi:NhaP-type Na+/H+ or K+/H+ antiporter